MSGALYSVLCTLFYVLCTDGSGVSAGADRALRGFAPEPYGLGLPASIPDTGAGSGVTSGHPRGCAAHPAARARQSARADTRYPGCADAAAPPNSVPAFGPALGAARAGFHCGHPPICTNPVSSLAIAPAVCHGPVACWRSIHKAPYCRFTNLLRPPAPVPWLTACARWN